MTRKILVINPVATDEWNASDMEYIKSIAAADTAIDLVNIPKGPTSIESFYDESFAVPAILQIVRENKDKYDGMMINCFADPGVSAAREICDIPIAGPGESGMMLATLLGHKFSIISVKKNVVPLFEMKAKVLGLESKLASVEYIDTPVSELEKEKDNTLERLVVAAKRAIQEKQAEVLVLGCTGMLSFHAHLRAKVDVPVIEPAAAAIKLLEKIIDLKLSHSRAGLYAYPIFEKIKGY